MVEGFISCYFPSLLSDLMAEGSTPSEIQPWFFNINLISLNDTFIYMWKHVHMY